MRIITKELMGIKKYTTRDYVPVGQIIDIDESPEGGAE